LHQTATVKLGRKAEQCSWTSDAVAPGGSVGVKIAGSQTGVTYRLIDSQNRSLSDSVCGNGSEISLCSVSLLADQVVRVHAIRSTQAFTDSQEPRDILGTRLVTVRATEASASQA
jgi:hypothetical protein